MQYYHQAALIVTQYVTILWDQVDSIDGFDWGAYFIRVRADSLNWMNFMH